MLATLFKEPHLASVLMSTTYQMSTLGSTVGQQDPVAVVSKARESLRALREAQVIESVTQRSGIACNVATWACYAPCMQTRCAAPRECAPRALHRGYTYAHTCTQSATECWWAACPHRGAILCAACESLACVVMHV